MYLRGSQWKFRLLFHVYNSFIITSLACFVVGQLQSNISVCFTLSLFLRMLLLGLGAIHQPTRQGAPLLYTHRCSHTILCAFLLIFTPL